MVVVAHLLNFALSLLIWLIIGRAVLRFLVGDRRNFIVDLFRLATDPLFRLIRRLTPRFVGDGLIPWLSILVLLALRVALLPLLRPEGGT